MVNPRNKMVLGSGKAVVIPSSAITRESGAIITRIVSSNIFFILFKGVKKAPCKKLGGVYFDCERVDP